MKLLDSNLVIYSAQPDFAYLRPLMSDPDNQVSHFTMLEVLGYHILMPVDKTYFESVFAILDIKEMSVPISSIVK